MAKSYSLSRVKAFIDRIRAEKQRAEKSLGRAKAKKGEFLPGSESYFQGKVDLCEDLISAAELHFGPEVSWEGKE